MKNTGIIHIFPLGMDERTIALLDTAFQMYYEEHYQLVDQEQSADLIIIDIDNPQDQKTLSHFFKTCSHLPYLVISASQIGPECFSLQKPIRVENLFPMLKQVRTTPPKPDCQLKTLLLQQYQSDPERHNLPVKLVLDLSQVEFFDSSKGLLGCIKTAQAGDNNVIILFEKQPVLAIRPKEKIALLSCHLGTLQRLCQLAADNQFELRPIPDNSPLPVSPSFPLFNLLWQLAIWSANGRLEQNIKPDSPLIIKAWPNFTRIAPIPNAMRMTAFLIRMPVNMIVLHKLLNIPPSVIFNYLAAMQAVDYLVTIDRHTPTSTQTCIEEQNEKTKVTTNTKQENIPLEQKVPDKQSGKFLQKLLKKLSVEQ